MKRFFRIMALENNEKFVIVQPLEEGYGARPFDYESEDEALEKIEKCENILVNGREREKKSFKIMVIRMYEF
jgi:hypothetical protein